MLARVIRTAAVLIFALIVGTPAAAQESNEIELPDATVADPAHYSVELENDHVRVVRIRYGAHEHSPMHSHRPAVYVFLADQQARFTEEDGTVTTGEVRAGTVGWSGPDSHSVENLGDGPLEIIAVEPKPRALCDVGSADSDRDAIRRAVLTHLDAINRGDMEAVSDHHTADAGGFVTELGPRITFQSAESAPMLVAAFEGAKPHWTVRDLQIQLLGDVGVASFYMDGSTTWPDGRVDSRPRRVTEVWVCSGGEWKEAHHHDDPLGT